MQPKLWDRIVTYYYTEYSIQYVNMLLYNFMPHKELGFEGVTMSFVKDGVFDTDSK